MKFILLRLVIVILGILAGVAGTIIYAFFPGSLMLITLGLFIVAGILAWRYNEVVDAELTHRWKQQFPNNPDVLDEDKK